MMLRLQNLSGPYINGRFHVSPVLRQLIQPRTGQPFHQVQEATGTQVQDAVTGARAEGVRRWQQSPSMRRDAMNQLADAMVQNRDALTELEILQTGKPHADAVYEIGDAIECLRYFAGFADKLMGESMGMSTFSVREPYGVAGLVTSFNYPLMLAAWKLGPALAAGNTCILKPAPQTPLTALALAQLSTGVLPPGVLQVLPGGAQVGQAVLENVDKISFTGSTRAGQAIMRRQADRLTPLTLECGGKNPAIVLDDADVQEAARHVAVGAFSNAGQNCCAIARVLVHESIYEPFLDALKNETEQHWVAGEHYGPLIDLAQYENVRRYLGLESAFFRGVVHREEQGGYFVPATIFANVQDDHVLAREEIFGPVLTVLKPFDTLDSAVERANNSPYGLAAGIFTKDYRKAHQVASKLKTGYVWINTYNIMPPYSPFGGRKLSGIGNELGKMALDSFTFTKTVVME